MPDHAPGSDPPRAATRRVTIPAAVAPLLLQFPELDSRIWVLAVARLIVTAGFSAVMPFLAMHLAVDRGVPLMKIGLLWTVVGLCSASMQWVAGQVADRVGRRPVLLTAMLVRSVNLAAMGYAVGVEASFGAIAALCLVNGAMRAFYDPVASAVVASLASPDERVAAFSLHRVGSSLGWAAGPMAATLASGASYSLLFYVAAPVTLLAALAMARIPETRAPAAPRPRLRLPDFSALRGDTVFLRFLAATFAFYLVQTQMYHIMSIYAARDLGLDRAQVATLFTLNGVLVVLIQLPAVRYIRHVGTRGALVVGSLGYFVGYAACGVATSYLPLLLCVAVITCCEIVAVPAQQSAVTGMAPPDKVAGYAGTFGLVQGAAQTVGPVLGSVMLELLAPTHAWFLLGMAGLAAAYGYRRRGHAGPQHTLTPSPRRS